MGETQGYLILPTLINLIVDNVVWDWRALTVKYKLVTHEGMGPTAGRCLRLFYDNNSMVG